MARLTQIRQRKKMPRCARETTGQGVRLLRGAVGFALPCTFKEVEDTAAASVPTLHSTKAAFSWTAILCQ